MIDEEWVQRWVNAVNGAEAHEPAAEGAEAVVLWECDGMRWWVRLGDDRLVAGRGEPPDAPTVTFTTDAATATAVHDGVLAVEDAVLSGRLVVRGDVVRLPALRPGLDAVGAAARGRST